MEKDEANGKTPSLAGQTVAAKSADGVNDLDNSTADNNQDDVVASPPSALQKKRLDFSSNKRQSTKSPPAHSPLSKETAKKTTKKAKHSLALPHGQKSQWRRKGGRSTNILSNVTNASAKENPSSSNESPIKGKNLNFLSFQRPPSPRRTRSSQQQQNNNGYKITPKAIIQRLRRDTFGGRTTSSENVYDLDEVIAHDVAFASAANNAFGHHNNISLPQVKAGYLTNDMSDLSRFLLEDMLVQHSDCNEHPLVFRVLVSKPKTKGSERDSNLSALQSLASKISWHQQRHGDLGVHIREVMGTKYYELYATLVPNETHKSIKEGQLAMSEIEELLKGEDGFELRFEGTSSMSENSTMKIKWRDMVEYPGDIMVFGPRITTIRSFSSLFIDKQNLDYIHHIFRQLALEVRGDTVASLALIGAYQEKRAIVYAENEKISSEKTEKRLIDAMTFLGVEQSNFFQKVDDTFRGAIDTCLVSFQVFSEPIVSRERIIDMMEECQQLFPIVWKALENLRGTLASIAQHQTPCKNSFSSYRRHFFEVLSSDAHFRLLVRP